ncbi:MAG TPA: DNA polymerase III subunit delta [Acidimicrobiales bacterium]|nr:DNA polymerase III subunit delta [Acidimicrobiales bacterium]
MTPPGTTTGSRRAAAVGADEAAPVYLVRGEDASLVAQAARVLVRQLVGRRDPALVVEEHGGSAAEDLDVGAVVDACTTPPFLVDRRVVVVRDAGKLSAADAKRLTTLLADPLPTSVLVLVSGGGTVPAALVKAVGAAGEVVDTSVASGRDRSRWIAEQLKGAPVHLDAAAAGRVSEHLGDDLGRLAGLLETLAAAYGEHATVHLDELEPFLGEAGGVPPWELTDAVDSGSTEVALAALRRMMGPGGRSAPEVLATVHRHFSNLLRLDGSGAVAGEDAAALLGLRSAFPAQKALAQTRRLGTERIGEAVNLIAAADLDVKGQSALPPELVMEILVARLSRLVRVGAPARRR